MCWNMPEILAFDRLRQRGCYESEAGLGCMGRSYFRETKIKGSMGRKIF